MKKFLLLLFLVSIAFVACGCAKEKEVALNDPGYIKFVGIVEKRNYTPKDIDEISRTTMPDGTTSLDFMELKGYEPEELQSDRTDILCSLIEYNNGVSSLDGNDYEIRFDCADRQYLVAGKIVVESERIALYRLFCEFFENFNWERAVYLPMDSKRAICFGDNGNKDSNNVYYYDKDQYESVLREYFSIE